MRSINNEIIKNNIIYPFEIKFYPKIATILLWFKKETINTNTKKDIAKKLGLLEKEEIHVTIIGSNTGKEIIEFLWKSNQKQKDEIWNKIVELCESFDWKITLKNEFFYIKKHYDSPKETRQSIIQIIWIAQLDKFYKKLNILLWTQFKVPFPHITLYTNSTIEATKFRGIGTYSKEQFDELIPKKV